jgi:hypothetical protein
MGMTQVCLLRIQPSGHSAMAFALYMLKQMNALAALRCGHDGSALG